MRTPATRVPYLGKYRYYGVEEGPDTIPLESKTGRNMTDPGIQVVKAFVVYLRTHGHPGLKVNRWPDQVNRKTPDIDAIAGHFAIEHTSIDTVEKQRKTSAHFTSFIGDIRNELKGKVPFRLRITIQQSAIKVGQDWSAIRTALKDWIVTIAPSLSDGRHSIDEGAIPGVPFGLIARKASDRPPNILFQIIAPTDTKFADRLRKQLTPKVHKLAKYHPKKTTVLLLESNDMINMNGCILLDAIQAAYPEALPPGIDQVWYADTSVSGTEVIFAEFTEHLCTHRRVAP